MQQPCPACAVVRYPTLYIAEHRQPLVAEVRNVGLRIPVPQADLRRLQGDLQLLATLAQRLLHLQAFGDVLKHPDLTDDLAVFAQRHRNDRDWKYRAVASCVDILFGPVFLAPEYRTAGGTVRSTHLYTGGILEVHTVVKIA